MDLHSAFLDCLSPTLDESSFDDNKRALPPWLKRPDPMDWSGMGLSSSPYVWEFYGWFASLDDELKKEYMEAYPKPESWEGFLPYIPKELESYAKSENVKIERSLKEALREHMATAQQPEKAPLCPACGYRTAVLCCIYHAPYGYPALDATIACEHCRLHASTRMLSGFSDWAREAYTNPPDDPAGGE